MNSSAPLGVATAPNTIRFERLLPGPVDRIWAYLTDSDKRGQWLASGVMPAVTGDAFDMRFDHRNLSDDVAPTPERYHHLEGGHVSRHRVLRWEPPHVLALSWSDGAGGESDVTFELAPEGDDVRLVLTHRRLANGDVLRNVAKGWHTHLEVLGEKLRGRPTKSFWTLINAVDGVYDQKLVAE
ncbi:MAG TPA: SRPBCC family protein [Caulobacteraceae bacterium]|jgi:uncharacterized protein YndB with AHSA1/START domain|nr:SRPBCC family protein [Caulobacteraceae bacterium]